MISGLRDDPSGEEQALDIRLDRLNGDVSLLRLGRDYWRQNAEVQTNQSIEDHTTQDNLTNQSNPQPIENSIGQIETHNPPLSNQPEITTVPGKYDAPTNEDDNGTYFEKVRNLLGERNPHNTFVANAMADQEMLR
jgi:hypothetical protein